MRHLGLMLGFVVALAATPTSALLVQPVYLDMSYTGVRSSGGVRVVNDRNRPVAVELTVSSVEIPETGDPVFTPNEGEDFLIFPAVGNIPAGGTQIFRIRWIGEPTLESKLYAVTTSELPIETDTEASAAIQMLYAIQTIVALGPESGRADIEIEAVERQTLSDGRQGLRMLFVNNGNRHGQMNEGTIRVSAGNWSHTFDQTAVSSNVGLGLLSSGGRRWMFFPLDGVPSDGDLQARLDLVQRR